MKIKRGTPYVYKSKHSHNNKPRYVKKKDERKDWEILGIKGYTFSRDRSHTFRIIPRRGFLDGLHKEQEGFDSRMCSSPFSVWLRVHWFYSSSLHRHHMAVCPCMYNAGSRRSCWACLMRECLMRTPDLRIPPNRDDYQYRMDVLSRTEYAWMSAKFRHTMFILPENVTRISRENIRVASFTFPIMRAFEQVILEHGKAALYSLSQGCRIKITSKEGKDWGWNVEIVGEPMALFQSREEAIQHYAEKEIPYLSQYTSLNYQLTNEEDGRFYTPMMQQRIHFQSDHEQLRWYSRYCMKNNERIDSDIEVQWLDDLYKSIFHDKYYRDLLFIDYVRFVEKHGNVTPDLRKKLFSEKGIPVTAPPPACVGEIMSPLDRPPYA